MPTTTTNYSFQKPVVGADEDAWGGYINNNFDSLDSLLSGTTALTSLNITGDFTVDTDTLHVDSTNNLVGIGTNSPLTPLSVYGNTVVKYSLQSGSGVGGGLIGWYDNTDTRQQYIGTPSNADTEFRIFQEANDDMVFATNSTQRMRIKNDGDIGIGTSSPSRKVHVADTLTYLNLQDTDGTQGGSMQAAVIMSDSADATAGAVGFVSTTTGVMSLRNDGGNLEIDADLNNSDANSIITFGVDGDEKARINAAGDILVGTTDTTLYNNTTGGGALIRSNGNVQIANDGADCLRLNRMTSTGQIAYFYQAGTNVGNISVTGSATAYNTSSDYRLKEDWQPMTDACDRVLTLKPVNFAWKVDGSRVDGFLAHELGDVVPEAVTGQKDEVDDEGNPVYQGIDQSKLVPLLTAALQEALTKIEALETRIAAIEG
jgi:hypothetical protein